jgi:4-amino-4-deoxy-L-arabinose transferase-like glycosyltransferase
VAAVVVVAFALRAITAQGHMVTTDETNWMGRSYLFHEALTSADFASASAMSTAVAPDADATMPGVTTMWVGAVAQSLWSVGDDTGLVGEAEGATYLTDPSGLDLAQTTMALVAALALGVLTWLVARWAGRGAAAVAGLLLATEPFFVAHGAVLHTDELTALFGAAAFVATALALGVPRRSAWTGRWGAGALAGALWGLSLLTKLTALVFVPGLVLVGVWAVAAALRRARSAGGDASGARAASDARAALAPVARVAAGWVGAAVVVVVALYPALWVAPMGEWASLRRSFAMASSGHQQFFMGKVVDTPGPAFYGVALPLRMTPWFLLASLVAAVAVWRRPTRAMGLAVACMGVPALVLLSVASKQFDRYGLSVLVACALAVGLVAAAAARDVAERWPGRRPVMAGAAATAALVVSAYSLSIAPWGLGYYNPALGGADTAVDAVLVGWWEGVEQAGPIIAERQRGDCAEVTIQAPQLPLLFPCGTLGGGRDATYLVLYVSQWQRAPEAARQAAEGRDLITTIEERGITYIKLYGPRRPDATTGGDTR